MGTKRLKVSKPGLSQLPGGETWTGFRREAVRSEAMTNSSIKVYARRFPASADGGRLTRVDTILLRV